PAPAPRDSGVTRDDQIAAAIFKIVAALAANVVANDPSNDALPRLLARGLRDAAIESALHDAFPELSQRQAEHIAFFIASELDGTLNRRNVAVHFTKQYVMDRLRAIDPILADVARIADLVYRVQGALAS